MRFLVDQNLPASVAARLATAGQDAQHTSALHLERAYDEDLFEWCRLHDAVLLTADKRLTKYLATQRASSLSVVVARGYLLAFAQLAADVLDDLDAVTDVIGSHGHAVFSMSPEGPTFIRHEPWTRRWEANPFFNAARGMPVGRWSDFPSRRRYARSVTFGSTAIVSSAETVI